MADVRTFRTSGEFESWLGKNHAKSNGIWIRAYKKGHRYYLNNIDILNGEKDSPSVPNPAPTI